MNIFYLDPNPDTCAEMHCDKHVVKMIIEYAQLMSTAHRVLDGDQYLDKTANGRNIKRWRLSNSNLEQVIYKASHINHPSAIWTRQSKQQYEFVYNLFQSLCKEYTHRYGKEHLTQTKLDSILCDAPLNIEDNGFTNPPQAMPDDVKSVNTLEAYQAYYRNYKIDFAKWTNRVTPEFMYE
tara:strand:+ start:978 stop:1517 length:540 start_codon:yes stop_codon:yes gene_type:complete